MSTGVPRGVSGLRLFNGQICQHRGEPRGARLAALARPQSALVHVVERVNALDAWVNALDVWWEFESALSLVVGCCYCLSSRLLIVVFFGRCVYNWCVRAVSFLLLERVISPLLLPIRCAYLSTRTFLSVRVYLARACSYTHRPRN